MDVSAHRSASGTVAALALVVALAGVTSACAPSVRAASAEAARAATPAAADASLQVLEDANTRARVASVLGTPEMRQATRALAEEMAQGALAGIASERSAEVVDAAVARFTHALAESLAREATLPEHQAAQRRFVRELAAESVRAAAAEVPRTLGPALREAILRDLGPAIGESVRRDIGPSLGDALRTPELQASLAEAGRAIAKNAVVGSDEGLAELAEKKKREQGSGPLGQVVGLFASRAWLVVLLAAALVLGAPLLWLLHERRRVLRWRSLAERRRERTAAILAALEVGAEDEWRRRVIGLLRAELSDDDEPSAAPERPPPKPSRPATATG